MLSLCACGDAQKSAQEPVSADTPVVKQEEPARKQEAKPIAKMQEDEIVAFLKDNVDKGSEYYTEALKQFKFCELEKDRQINVNKCPAKKALRDKELAAKLAPRIDGILVAAQDADQKVRAGAFVVIEDHRIKKR